MLPGEPLERHEATGSFGAWMRAHVPGYGLAERHPVVVTANGAEVPPEDWDALDAAGDIEVRVKAQGDVLGFFTGLLQNVFGFLVPNAPKIRTPVPGQELLPAEATANEARLGQVIPEIAGRYKRFPDYLLPPHRYFVDEREQWLELLLCVGKGRYSIAASAVRVGDTPLISLGDDAEFTLYEPGDDLSGDDCAVWWHTAPEVGSSSKGTAGLELKATFTVEQATTATAFQFDGYDVTIPSGAGAFPDGWTSGMIARIEQYRDYQVTDGGSGADIISGDLEDLELFVGMVIEIAGDNAGTYVVDSYDPGDSITPPSMTLAYEGSGGLPVTSLATGSRRMAIGYDGLRYRLTAAGTASISVERLDDTGDTATWSGWTYFDTTDADIRLDPTTTEGDWAGPFSACPVGEVTDALEWDVFFPQGLAYITDKGKVWAASVEVELQYRDADTAGAWTSVLRTYNAATRDQIGYTEMITLPSAMRAEVRMRRTVAPTGDAKNIEEVQWYGLRARLDAPTSYDGVTVLSVRLRGGERLAAQAENLVSVECTRLLPVLDNGAFGETEEATRSIAAWVRHVASTIGYTDDQIDLDELARLDAIWAERGDYYDYVHGETTVRDVINQALRAGFAEMTVDAGRIRPVRDEPREQFEHLYTPQNMTAPLRRSFEAVRPDDPDGVTVEYVDEDTWADSVVECRLPGDAGIKSDKLKLEGVTGRTQAWRIGMRARRAARYRRWAYEWQTELDALNSRYLSYCAVADDVPGYGKSSVLIACEATDTGAALTLSEPMEWGEGSHVVAVRAADGSMLGPFAASRGATDFDVLAEGMDPIQIDPQREPPHVLFGTTETWSFPVLVTSINPNGFEAVTVSAVNYDARVYADDDNSPS
jgi:hypothetical protein